MRGLLKLEGIEVECAEAKKMFKKGLSQLES